VLRQTILQVYAPDEMRGRLQGVFVVVVAGGPRLGDLRAGATAAVAGATFSWVAGGIASIVIVLVAVALVPAFRRYDASTPPAAARPAELEEPAEPSLPPFTADDEAVRDVAVSDRRG
jgi:hypothetical protein